MRKHINVNVIRHSKTIMGQKIVTSKIDNAEKERILLQLPGIEKITMRIKMTNKDSIGQMIKNEIPYDRTFVTNHSFIYLPMNRIISRDKQYVIREVTFFTKPRGTSTLDIELWQHNKSFVNDDVRKYLDKINKMLMR